MGCRWKANGLVAIFVFLQKSPPEAGLPIGGGDLQYAVLEWHYDNPSFSKSNQADNSGLKMWYTTTKRKYDAQILQIGMVVGPEQFLPPEQPAIQSYSYCPAEATTVSVKFFLVQFCLCCLGWASKYNVFWRYSRSSCFCIHASHA